MHLHACRRVQEAVRTSRMWTSTAPVPVVMITRVLTLQAPLQQLSPPSQVVPLHMGQVIVVLMRNAGQIQPVHEWIHTLRAAQHTLFSIAGQHWSAVPAGLRFCVRIVMQAQASPGAAVLGICQHARLPTRQRPDTQICNALLADRCLTLQAPSQQLSSAPHVLPLQQMAQVGIIELPRKQVDLTPLMRCCSAGHLMRLPDAHSWRHCRIGPAHQVPQFFTSVSRACRQGCQWRRGMEVAMVEKLGMVQQSGTGASCIPHLAPCGPLCIGLIIHGCWFTQPCAAAVLTLQAPLQQVSPAPQVLPLRMGKVDVNPNTTSTHGAETDLQMMLASSVPLLASAVPAILLNAAT